MGIRNRVDWNDISDESSDVFEPVPSAGMFSPGDVASVCHFSSGTLFSDSFGLSLRLIIREKMNIVKRGNRKKRVAKGIVYGKPKNCIRLEPPGGFCQSFYIGDSDDGGNDIEADVVPLVSYPETDIARAGAHYRAR